MAIRQATTKPSGAEPRQQLFAGCQVTERRPELAGISTPVFEAGEGAPLVLLHGPGGNAAHWFRVIPDLAATNRVIVPDLPGQGGSEVAEGPLDADRVLTWLGELIEDSCQSSPAIVGYALGGALAARFAARQGHRLGRLVLVDSLGLAGLNPAPEFGVALGEFMADPTEHTHDGLWRHCALDLDGLRERMGEDWEPFATYNLDRARAPSVQAALGALMEQFGGPPIATADLQRITVPTTLIWGRHDLATPLSVAETASGRYGWPLEVIDHCADDPPVEQPDAFVRVLRVALADPAALAEAGFNGEVVDRRHARYDELRAVFNGMIDRRPALIARCGDARDVSVAVCFARDRRLPVSVYGGGHNVTGNAVCEHGVTVDLRPMKAVQIDAEARTCRVQAGLTWGELDAATQQHGLAVTGGRMSTTGLGGLVLGGGSGWIERSCGYTVDSLRSLELVTADGRILTASETENPDLFWGSRGGGGNFGVATSFELELHPIGPTVLGGMLIYPAPMAAAVLRNFRDVMADAPDELGAGVALITAPPEEFVPEAVRGQPVAGVIVCYTGPDEAGEQALAPLRAFGPPVADLVGPTPYVALQQLIDSGYPAGMRNYWTGEFLAELPDEAIEVLCRFHLSKPSPLTQIITLPGGGAAARVPDGTMAVGERHAPLNLHITSLWQEPADDAANIAWTRQLSAAIRPYTTGRVYVNFIGDEGRDRVVASFGAEAYARLQAIKHRYDPHNLFASNQNIEPSGRPEPG